MSELSAGLLRVFILPQCAQMFVGSMAVVLNRALCIQHSICVQQVLVRHLLHAYRRLCAAKQKS